MDPLIEDIALMVPCPVCESFAWCVTRTGRRANELHARRTDPIREAYLLGQRTAQQELRARAAS